MDNSNDGVVNIIHQQEIRPPAPSSGQISTVGAPAPAQHNNDYESPVPTMKEMSMHTLLLLFSPMMLMIRRKKVKVLKVTVKTITSTTTMMPKA